MVSYKGRHGRVVSYGSIATDGRRFFRTYKKFDKETVLRYLRELNRHFGKVAIIMDSAPQHTAKIVKEFLKENSDIRVIWLPTATPELSAIENYWRQAKRSVLVSEHYSTLQYMRHSMSEYFRTSRLDLDVMKFVQRKSITPKNF